jgi:Transglycosylase-like domain
LKRILVAGTTLVILSGFTYLNPASVRGGRVCRKLDGQPVLFTIRMGVRAADAVYSHSTVTRRERKMLLRIVRCQHNPNATPYVRALIAHQYRAWEVRTTSPPSLAYGQWAIPAAIVGCESTYQNQPPNGDGASGYYQIIPTTWISYGGGAYASQAYLASRSGQDTVAARIWDGGRGAGQWTCASMVAW